MDTSQATIRAAYAECRALVRRHYENFPVASLLVPRGKRDALAAIYAFARVADDFADEPVENGGPPTPAARLAALAAWRAQLQECLELRVSPRHPVFIALRHASTTCHLNPANFSRLLDAFERDARQNTHPDFASVLDYCTCSANPVGRLVLELFGAATPRWIAWSDAICTGLQLANFWQDVAIDLARDRIYLPLDELESFGLSAEQLRQLARGEGREDWQRWQRLMQFQIGRTVGFFEQGLPLVLEAPRALRLQLRLTWLGGVRILEKIAEAEGDVFRRRPKLGAGDAAGLLLRLLPGRQMRYAPSPRGT